LSSCLTRVLKFRVPINKKSSYEVDLGPSSSKEGKIGKPENGGHPDNTIAEDRKIKPEKERHKINARTRKK
jgi:hypothetical protein